MERNRKRKNGATKEYISIQSTVNVTVSSQAEKRVGYIDKFMSKADFTARNGKQVCIYHELIYILLATVFLRSINWFKPSHLEIPKCYIPLQIILFV